MRDNIRRLLREMEESSIHLRRRLNCIDKHLTLIENGSLGDILTPNQLSLSTFRLLCYVYICKECEINNYHLTEHEFTNMFYDRIKKYYRNYREMNKE